MTESRANAAELTVSELSASLKRTVEDAYGYVRVRGEISGYRGPHSSGHVYLALKDERAKIDGVIWKGVFGKMRIKPEEGMEVIVTGRLTTYPNRSSYQIIVETLEPAGLGALMALLEERRKTLAAEGLFDPARKQLLPFLPNVIGVVTSPTGAVIRDILHRLQDRFPRHVIVWPVRVQGEGSAAEVAAAIHGFNALPQDGPVPRPDIIIVARGGGSLEDLWSFNEEIVVRAAADSMIPLVSAVGHETDVTLIDHAADRRAPTPTAAAEIAVPVRSELIAELMSKARRALACWQRSQQHRRTELRAAARALPSADALLAVPRQRLDGCAERLPRALRANAQIHHTQFSRVASRLSPSLLRSRMDRCRELVAGLGERNTRAQTILRMRQRERLSVATARLGTALKSYRETQISRIARQKDQLESLFVRARRAADNLVATRSARADRAGQLLAAYSYRGVLSRGFALVRDTEGRPLRSAAAVAPGQRLDIEFADGRRRATADGSGTAPTPPAPRPRRSSGGSEGSGGAGGQGSLFGV